MPAFPGRCCCCNRPMSSRQQQGGSKAAVRRQRGSKVAARQQASAARWQPPFSRPLMSTYADGHFLARRCLIFTIKSRRSPAPFLLQNCHTFLFLLSGASYPPHLPLFASLTFRRFASSQCPSTNRKRSLLWSLPCQSHF